MYIKARRIPKEKPQAQSIRGTQFDGKRRLQNNISKMSGVTRIHGAKDRQATYTDSILELIRVWMLID